MQFSITDVLSPFGALKNPVLFSSGSFSGSMLFFGQQHTSEAAGLLMIVLAAVIFMIGLGFYAFAFMRLPSNTQQELFLQEAKAALRHHAVAARRRQVSQGKPGDGAEQE